MPRKLNLKQEKQIETFYKIKGFKAVRIAELLGVNYHTVLRSIHRQKLKANSVSLFGGSKQNERNRNNSGN